MYDNNENLPVYDSGISGIGDSPGDLLEAPETVSSGDLDLQVSQGDAQNVTYLQMVPETDTPDYTEALAHIDVLLSVIVFVMIFDWCCRHIHNIVRMFTGRNLK